MGCNASHSTSVPGVDAPGSHKSPVARRKVANGHTKQYPVVTNGHTPKHLHMAAQELTLLSRVTEKKNNACVEQSWRTSDTKELLRQSCNHDLWHAVDSIRQQEAPYVEPHTKRRGWKTVRLFVSSTFKDMHSEREFLVKRVFPELRLWCEQRKLRLVECDLRWGVPKDADTRQVLMACLSEIDRCYEENEFPYFLNMLSQRYGWVPRYDQVPDDIKHRYKWLPGMSVTSLEIFTGAYWINNPHALYMLREPDFLKDVNAADIRKNYEELPSSTEEESLATLKDKLKSTFHSQVHEYTCALESADERSIRLSGLEKFGDTVLQHFKRVIDHQYPSDSLGEVLSAKDIQRMEHEAFMVQRSQILLGRDAVLKKIERYLTGELQSPTPLVLVGFPGAGKSAVVAHVARIASNDSTCKLSDSLPYDDHLLQTFYHFVGATPGSTDLYRLLVRLWQELLPADDKVPSDFNDLKYSMATVLRKAAESTTKSGQKRLVVLIDALNQMDDTGDAHALTWLPKELPENVRIIVSTLEGKCLDALRSSEVTLPEVAVDPLDVSTRKEIISQILAEYNKILDKNQLDALARKFDAGRPLFLAVASEELRVFGEFRRLDEKINNLAGDLTALLQQVLQRIVSENGGDLVVATLCLIEVSRFGLLETELLELLASQPRVPSSPPPEGGTDAEAGRLPMVHWAMVYLGLKPFLRPSGGSGEGRLDFYHRTISKAVRALYLADNDAPGWYHAKLADYFEKCGDIERRAEELPYHLEATSDTERLKVTLLQQDMFDELYQEETKMQLMAYWRFIGGYPLAAAEYVKALETHFKAHKLEKAGAMLPLYVKLAKFLTDIGEYETSELLLSDAIARVEKEYGEKSQLLCEPLLAMVTMLNVEAIKVVYSSDPNYKKCSRLGTQYGKRCYELFKQYHDQTSREYGIMLTLCGHFLRDLRDQALEIFERIDYQPGIAEVLYMKAEGVQYSRDIEIPTSMFRRSLDLCKSHFGPAHLKTARCYQLWGQMYWNHYVEYHTRADFMVKCLEMYEQELNILELLLGPVHPTAVRSREDIVIILQTLKRNDEADILLAKQPADKKTGT